MIKLFSAAGNGSHGCPKLLYTHYKMVAGISEKGQDVCLITDPVVLSSVHFVLRSLVLGPWPIPIRIRKQTGKCQNLSSPVAMNA